MATQRVFVTGATGVLGRRAVPMLLEAGHEVTAVARSDDKADLLVRAGATPAQVDLFDGEAVDAAVAGHDVVAHLATNIPTGASLAIKRGWAVNDRLRREAAQHLSRAAISHGVGRYIGESITFPYVGNGADWIDERHDRTYFWGDRSTLDAEAAVHALSESGGVGVGLRFAMFFAIDSAHIATFASMARRGVFGLVGEDDAYTSFIGIDDAAGAVCAALDAPPGIYNVAEPAPVTRGDHRAALAAAVGRDRLRSLPKAVVKASGKSAENQSRSQRISSSALSDATGWTPSIRTVEQWGTI
jgi:nucleoside-diphosphate-sugar epimerase